MTEGTHSDRMRQLIETAVAAEIGDTRRLPRAAVDRIYTIYGAFLRVYIEVVRMTENHPPEWKPETLAIDPRVLVDMGHFFQIIKMLCVNSAR